MFISTRLNWKRPGKACRLRFLHLKQLCGGLKSCALMIFASSAQICYSYIISIRIPPWYYSLTFSKCLKNHLFRHFLFLLPLSKEAHQHTAHGKGLSSSAAVPWSVDHTRSEFSALSRFYIDWSFAAPSTFLPGSLRLSVHISLRTESIS